MAKLDRPEARSLGDMDGFTNFKQILKTFLKILFLIMKETYITKVGVCKPFAPSSILFESYFKNY